jgi:hypothetical protein
MKLCRVRFTVQRMMVWVATIALALGGIVWVGKMISLSAAYNRRAAGYHRLTGGVFSGGDESWAIRMHRDGWAREMEKKYRHAARYPWLPIGPDKPPPADAVRFGLGVEPWLPPEME